MGSCGYCGKSGFLTVVDENGLCMNCAPSVYDDIKQRLNIIQKTYQSLQGATKIAPILQKTDLILEQLKELTRYEQCGVWPAGSPLPSVLIGEQEEARKKAFTEGLEEELKQAEIKAATLQISSAKINCISKLLLMINELKPYTDDGQQLAIYESKVNNVIHKIKLDSYLENAKKAEFMGQKKKALSQYMEALYFLKTDGINDTLQKGNIGFLEAKIKELSGKDVANE